MIRFQRFLCIGPLLLACVLCFFGSVPYGWQQPTTVCLALGFGVLAIAAVNASLVLLGVALCLLPLFGAGVLSVVVSSWLLGSELRLMLTDEWEEHSSSERMMGYGFLALLLGFLGAAISPLLFYFDVPLLSSIVRFGGLASLVRWAQTQQFELIQIPALLLGYVSAMLLATHLCRLQRVRFGFAPLIVGLTIGALLSIVVLCLQYWDVHPVFSLNRGAFWRFVGRYSASFSDPNAFGVTSLLLVPILLLSAGGRLVALSRFAAVVLMVGVLWSGSRTVWLGLTTWVIVLTAMYFRRTQSRGQRMAMIAVFCASCVGVAALGNPYVQERLEPVGFAPGVQRILDTLHWENGAGRLNSRWIYGQIALQMWKEKPLSGVGVRQFYHHQSASAAKAGIDLGEWRDNANNFYLQVLAEGGLLGLTVLLFAFVLFSSALSVRNQLAPPVEYSPLLASPNRLRWLSQMSLGVFALVLFFGPHLFFDEVRYVMSILFAFGVCYSVLPPKEIERTARRRLLAATFAVPFVYVACFVFYSTGNSPRGFYQAEQGATGPVRWSAGTAYFSICDDVSTQHVFQLSAPRADLQGQPLKVRLERESEDKFETVQAIELRDTRWHQLTVPVAHSQLATGITRYRIKVSSLWNPSGGSTKGDTRWLGVMLKWPSAACE